MSIHKGTGPKPAAALALAPFPVGRIAISGHRQMGSAMADRVARTFND
jgi:hypothetical protein